MKQENFAMGYYSSSSSGLMYRPGSPSGRRNRKKNGSSFSLFAVIIVRLILAALGFGAWKLFLSLRSSSEEREKNRSEERVYSDGT